MATIEDLINDANLASKGGFASEDTLKELRDAVKNAKRQDDRSAGSLGKQAKKAEKDVKVMGSSIAKVNPALAALEAGFNILGSAISGTAGLVRSVMAADGSFESLGSVVDFAADRIADTFGRIPIVGGFISASARATAEVTKLRLAFMDIQKETFQNLAASGLRLDTSLGDVIATVLRANISIDAFNRLTTQNADGLRVFGGTIGNAATKFSMNIEKLTGDQSEIGLGLRLLGLGSTEIAEEFADFIQTNRNNSRLLTMDETELNKQLQDRIKSERVIAEITGISAQEQRNQQMQLAGEAAFQAALMAFPADQRDVLTTFVSGLTGPAQDAAKQLLAFGTITDEQTALLSSAAPGLIEAIQGELNAIKGGARDADASVARILAVGAQSAEQLTQLTKLGILDPSFSAALGEFFLQITRSNAQLEAFRLAEANLGREIGNQEDLVAAVNEVYAEQFKIAENLKGQGKLTEATLKKAADKTGVALDSETARIIVQAAQVEEAVGTLQSEIFELVRDNAGLLGDITVEIIASFDRLIKALDKRSDFISLDQEVLTLPSGSSDNFTLAEKEKVIQDTFMRSDNPVVNAIGKQFGGPVGSNTLAMVGEAGRELLKMGNSAGEVINNATTEKIMGAAESVVNNIGNGGNDSLKRLSDLMAQSNAIQSNILKETRRSKGFEY